MGTNQVAAAVNSQQASPSSALMHAAMDDTAEYSATSPKTQWRAAGIQQVQKAAERDDVYFALRRLFLRAMEFANAPSTPKVPTTFCVNVANEGERDRFEFRIRMEPVTIVAHTMLETKGGADDHLHLLIASQQHVAAQRDAQLQALANEYAQAEAEPLIAAGWAA
jgi:hypothetical protein